VKADAEAAVREVNGVKGVNNNLQVKSPPTP
jgi:osmotically-inducible protein OsmY